MRPYLARALQLQATVQERLGRADAAESARAEVVGLEESLRANRQTGTAESPAMTPGAQSSPGPTVPTS
jgi:hypothetical protein